MYQKCPICQGTGADVNSLEKTSKDQVCPICKGKRIIDSVTGRPPLTEDNSNNKGNLLLS
jgi:hypothetical protein